MDYCNLIKEYYSGDYPTRKEFLESCQTQIFSLPKTLLNYILFKPKNKECYLKLVKTCKYIFLMNPVLLIHGMEHSEDECEGGRILLEECLNLCDATLIPLNRIEAKFWMHDWLEIINTDKQKMDLFISKIFRSEIKEFEFEHSTLSFEHYKTLCSEHVKWAKLGSVIYSDGSDVPIEALVELLPNVKFLEYYFREYASPETIKKLKKLPQFSRIKELYLRNP